VYCYSFFLLSFCTIICKLIVLPLTFFFFSQDLFEYFVDAELLQNICAFGVRGS
jgi:hypothetical protein